MCSCPFPFLPSSPPPTREAESLFLPCRGGGKPNTNLQKGYLPPPSMSLSTVHSLACSHPFILAQGAFQIWRGGRGRKGWHCKAKKTSEAPDLKKSPPPPFTTESGAGEGKRCPAWYHHPPHSRDELDYNSYRPLGSFPASSVLLLLWSCPRY